MPKELTIADDLTFILRFKSGDTVKEAPGPLDIWRCWNEICETRDRVGRNEPYVSQIDAVCDLMEGWGAGRPTHGAAIELSDQLFDLMELLKKKGGPAADHSTPPTSVGSTGSTASDSTATQP